MEQLSTIVKSKSNNGISLKPKKNKKSISDGDFTPNLVKKRGVYVDRKVFKSPLYTQEANDYETNRRPPPRPKPGQKRFLASILRILSKSTSGTQYPDTQDQKDIKNSKGRTRSGLRHETDPRTEKPNKQGKYKSRILNKNINNDDDQFIILQSTKEIAQTPSNYSEAFSIKEEKTKVHPIRDILLNNGVTKSIARDLLEEGPVKKEKKIRIKDEPETIASQIAKEGEKKIYNLFVDLLESTFNSYNLKDQTLSESNTALEINESVAKKLTITNKLESNDQTKNSVKKTPMKTTEHEKQHFEEPINVRFSNHKPLKRINPRVSVKSCEYTWNTKIPDTHSFPSKKRSIRNNRKRNLINIFKDELQKPTFEEPSNLFQALKVMAKNKHKKYVYEKKKHIRADDNLDRHECVLKRRMIISMKPKKTPKIIDRDIIGQKYSEYNSRFKKRERDTITPSEHSIKVYGFNYEEIEDRKNIPHVKSNEKLKKENKTRTVASTFSPFIMQSNLDYYTLLQFPDRSSCDFIY
ncbi:transcriptional regulator ATRX homolog [Nymphalis io]|uniref:transcriptional regulator ATRX homolog n=1 Tax=Inachis io TaxID=171585 RepID=UPI00216811D8|nr:transcriptional regulator ATRX homolog [Nymphalis io]